MCKITHKFRNFAVGNSPFYTFRPILAFIFPLLAYFNLTSTVSTIIHEIHNMKKFFLYVLAAIAATAIAGCTQVEMTPTPITPIYKLLEEYPSMNQSRRDSLMCSDSLLLDAMLKFIGKGNVNDTVLMEYATSPAMKVFAPAADSIFPKIQPLENTLGAILNNAKKHGFDLPERHYAAVVWGNFKSIVLTDSCMLIALNHYLGADYEGYAGWPEYMRRDKTPKRIAYDMAEALIANEFPYKRTSESTVLSRLIYEGALTMAKIKLVPYGTPAEALGYTDEQLEWLEAHESELWNVLVRDGLIYSTSENVATKLVNPTPSTSQLSPLAPGRAGRYIGYRILMSYIENNSATSLQYLLSPDFYDKPALLTESAYGG